MRHCFHQFPSFRTLFPVVSSVRFTSNEKVNRTSRLADALATLERVVRQHSSARKKQATLLIALASGNVDKSQVAAAALAEEIRHHLQMEKEGIKTDEPKRNEASKTNSPEGVPIKSRPAVEVILLDVSFMDLFADGADDNLSKRNEEAVEELLGIWHTQFPDAVRELKRQISTIVCEEAEKHGWSSSKGIDSGPAVLSNDTRSSSSAITSKDSPTRDISQSEHLTQTTPPSHRFSPSDANIAVHAMPPLSTDHTAVQVLQELKECCPFALDHRRRVGPNPSLLRTFFGSVDISQTELKEEARNSLRRFVRSTLLLGRLTDYSKVEQAGYELARKRGLLCSSDTIEGDKDVKSHSKTSNGSRRPVESSDRNKTFSHGSQNRELLSGLSSFDRRRVLEDAVEQQVQQQLSSHSITPSPTKTILSDPFGGFPDGGGYRFRVAVCDKAVPILLTSKDISMFAEAIAHRLNEWSIFTPELPVLPFGMLFRLRVELPKISH